MSFIQYEELFFTLHPLNEEKLGTHLSSELSLASAFSSRGFEGYHCFFFLIFSKGVPLEGLIPLSLYLFAIIGKFP